MEQDGNLDFNLWTSFADLMLALVLVLCLLLFLVMAVISAGTVNLKQVENNQQIIIDSIADNYHTKVKNEGDSYKISTMGNDVYDIEIKNDLNSQRITFSDKLLFQPDRTEMNENGQKVLDTLGKTLLTQSSLIKEIQIQGHADTRRSSRFESNTLLAALRGIEVSKYLQKVGIDPAKNLMSVTSFGEFKSVQREKTEDLYDQNKLNEDNADELLRGRNRRIEILLIYRR